MTPKFPAAGSALMEMHVKKEPPPKVRVTPIVVVFGAFLVIDFWISYRNAVFLLMSIITWPLICLGLLRALTTELTHNGASQMTLGGCKHMVWTEVEKVSRNGRSYWISGNGQKLLLWLTLFEDPDAAQAFVDAHLPSESQRSV